MRDSAFQAIFDNDEDKYSAINNNKIKQSSSKDKRKKRSGF